MSNRPRTDKIRNVWKVAPELIENPQATVREIADKVWLWSSTVQRAKEELAQSGTKDETIQYIVKSSKERIKRAQALFDRFITESEIKDSLDRHDTILIKDIVKDDQARVAIFGWDVTDEDWWLIQSMSTQDLLKLL